MRLGLLFAALAVLLPAVHAGHRVPDTRLWPGGLVAYQFASGLTAAQQQAFVTAMNTISSVCDVQFLPRTTEPNFLEYRLGTIFSRQSNNGFTTGTNWIEISPGNFSSQTVIEHEILHVLGFWHEQQRPDREPFVEVRVENIEGATRTSQVPQLIQIIDTPGGVMSGPYDFASHMHYAQFQQSRNGKRTFSVRPPYQKQWQFFLGKHLTNTLGKMSSGDIWALTEMYGGDPPPKYFDFASPVRGAIVGTGWTPSFAWQVSELADDYHLRVDDDVRFGSPEIDVILAGTTYVHPIALSDNTIYYWKLTARNARGETDAYPLPVDSFFTGASLTTVLFVDADAPPGGAGGSWATALSSLQDAMDRSEFVNGGVSEIRVAQGRYTPDRQTAARDMSFEPTSGLQIIGGFAGLGEPDPDERDPEIYETILSGDIAGNDFGGSIALMAENSHHVIYCWEVEEPALIDGFTIEGGMANGSPTPFDPRGPWGVTGGAVVSEEGKLTFRDCTFRNNASTSGGGVLFLTNTAETTIENCRFINNTSLGRGGASGTLASGSGGVATHWVSGASRYVGCTFDQNSAAGSGGAIANFGSHVTLDRCTFTSNTATNFGGAIYGTGINGASFWNQPESTLSPALTRVLNTLMHANTVAGPGGAMFSGNGSIALVDLTTVVMNTASFGQAAISADSTSSTTIRNSILVANSSAQIGGNTTVAYALIDGGAPGIGNITGGPGFVNQALGDFRLACGSPAVDAGDTLAVGHGTLADLSGGARFVDDPLATNTGQLDGFRPPVDMGAFEFGADDCNLNGVPDATDIADGTEADCNFDGIPDLCESTDCDGNGQLDVCEISQGTAADCDGDLVVDACPTMRSALAVATNRYLALAARATGRVEAIRITVAAAPPGREGLIGLSGWVMLPALVGEGSSSSAVVTGKPTFNRSGLGCVPTFADWSQFGDVFVSHQLIIPGATYFIQSIGEGCSPIEESAFSQPVAVTMARWGDVAGAAVGGQWMPPDGSVDVTVDVVAALDKFKNSPGAPAKVAADIQPATPDRVINIVDIVKTLDGFSGRRYPFDVTALPCAP